MPIEHRAILTKKEKDFYVFSLVKKENCKECPIASCCTIKSDKIFTVKKTKCNQNIKIGDEITIQMGKKTEFLGILLSYILPTFIIFASLSVTLLLGMKDENSALICIAMVLIYYLLLLFIKKVTQSDLGLKIKITDRKTYE